MIAPSFASADHVHAEDVMDIKKAADRAARIDSTLTHLVDGQKQINQTLSEVSESLQRLVVVEERQAADRQTLARTHDRLDKQDLKIDGVATRVNSIELSLPVVRLTSKGIIGAVTLALTMLGAAAITALLRGGT